MRFWLAFWALLLTLTSARADESYRTYQNARFGYSIVYPSGMLIPQPEADNGDGRKFRSRDGRITLTQEFEHARAAWKTDGARVTLSKLGSQFFALSGFIDDHIFYEKTVFYGDTFCTMIWEYPQSDRQRLDGPVTRSFASFTPGNWGQKSAAPPVKKAVLPRTTRTIRTTPARPALTKRPIAVPGPLKLIARPTAIARPKPVTQPQQPKLITRPKPISQPNPKVPARENVGLKGGY